MTKDELLARLKRLEELVLKLEEAQRETNTIIRHYLQREIISKSHVGRETIEGDTPQTR